MKQISLYKQLVTIAKMTSTRNRHILRRRGGLIDNMKTGDYRYYRIWHSYD